MVNLFLTMFSFNEYGMKTVIYYGCMRSDRCLTLGYSFLFVICFLFWSVYEGTGPGTQNFVGVTPGGDRGKE